MEGLIKNLLPVVDRLEYAERYFSYSPDYSKSVKEARRLFDDCAFSTCSKKLKKIPTVDQLMEQLVERLKGKSVYKTINRIIKEGKVDPIDRIKGLSSLLTHAMIEMHDNPEYAAVAKVVLERLNSLVYDL